MFGLKRKFWCNIHQDFHAIQSALLLMIIRMDLIIRFYLIVVCILFQFHSIAQPEGMIAIQAGKVFDSEKGVMLHHQVIIIKGGKVAEMGAALPIPKEARLLDLKKYTVLPGLIESHGHLFMSHPGDEHNTLTVLKAVTSEGDVLRALRGSARGKAYLEAGFTTVRDLGNSGRFADVALRQAIQEGSIIGPRLYVSGPGLASEGGQAPDIIHGQTHLIEGDYRIIRGVEDARNAVRENVYHGVDLIKIYSNSSPNKTFLSIDEMKAIVEEAHLYGLKVTAHATTDLAIRRALEAGVDAIEHAYVVSDSTLQKMKQQGVIMVPTDMDFLMTKKQVDKLKMDLTEEEIKKLAVPYHKRLQRAKKQGVLIAAGSDMYMDLGPSRGEAAKRVLFAYQEAGLNTKDILQSVTIHAAKLLGNNQLGNLKKGNLADLIAIEGNPLEHLSALEKVVFVMKEGVIYKWIK